MSKAGLLIDRQLLRCFPCGGRGERARDQLVSQRSCAVEVAQRLLDAPDVNGNIASDFVFVKEISRQGLHVPIEINTYNLAPLIDERAAGVSADGIRSGHEVERSIKIEFRFGSHPAFG